MRHFLAATVISLFAIGCSAEHKSIPCVSKVWVADNADGTYKNPILHADYSDPDVIRVGDDYYMTASSFAGIPGLPILHSKDLVNWTLIGHALAEYPDEAFGRPQHGNGVWAPSIRYHNGHFYIYWGDPDCGVFMVRSESPAGPWEKPVLVLAGKGIIDTCPLWDDDGKAYLVHAWAGSRAGVSSLLTLRQMNPEGTQVSREGKHVFDGHPNQPTIEGPKFYKRDGYYYIFAPAGGVTKGWQLAMRAKDIYGPYEEKIVLEQGTTSINGPHQGGWVQSPDGKDWFIHFQDKDAYGRVVHLQPMQWINGWPVMGIDKDGDGKGEPVLKFSKPRAKGECPIMTPAESDEFDTDSLGLQWQWQANPKITWYALIRGTGFLRLFAISLPQDSVNLADVPNVLLQKFPAPDFTATAKIKLTADQDGKRAGLMIAGDDYACLYITRQSLKSTEQKARSVSDGTISLIQSVCKNAIKGGKEEIVAERPLQTDTVYLRVKVSSPDARCQFSFGTDGSRFENIGKEFQAKPGRWIGAKVGLFCVSQPDVKVGGYADCEWFRIE
jgi:beta-xylosidase